MDLNGKIMLDYRETRSVKSGRVRHGCCSKYLTGETPERC